MQSRLFEVETILPSQHWTANEPEWRPEQRLMLAVLQDALVRLGRYLHRESHRSRRIVAEIERWIGSRSRSYPFAFESICDALGVEAGRLRRLVGEWRTTGRSPARCRRSHAGHGRHQVTAAE